MISKSFIEARVQKNPTTKCWLWIGTLNNAGYPQASDGGWVAVHRVVKTVYEGHVWQKGEFADHMCRVKHCVNPEHIRVTNRAVNQYHRHDAKYGSMAKRRLRIARDLHDNLVNRWEEKANSSL